VSYDLAICPRCRIQRRDGHIEHRQPFLDRLSHPAALIVAAVLGFEWTLVAVGVSEATKAKPGAPAAFRVEMPNPPHCSIERPERLFLL
jgi:hypothetical protein